MKAVITSIGEPTTALCKRLLERYGFEVVLMDEAITWKEKYRLFIERFDEDVLRIDADCLPLAPIVKLHDWPSRAWIVQTEQVDFYSWSVKPGGPLIYRQEALRFIRENIDDIDWRRPEATAFRLASVNGRTETVRVLASLHGFFQREEEHARAMQNRIDRHQLFDEEIINAITDLCQTSHKSQSTVSPKSPLET